MKTRRDFLKTASAVALLPLIGAPAASRMIGMDIGSEPSRGVVIVVNGVTFTFHEFEEASGRLRWHMESLVASPEWQLNAHRQAFERLARIAS